MSVFPCEQSQLKKKETLTEPVFVLRYSYRGYYCRRWEHDFYARKKYLQYVETKNDEVRRNLDDHNRKISQEEQKR